MTKIAEGCKARLTVDGEEFEGEVPLEEIEADTKKVVAGGRFTYIFDGYSHSSPAAFLQWANACFGPPSFYVFCSCDAKSGQFEERYKKRNEVEDVDENVLEEFAQQAKDAENERQTFQNSIVEHCGNRVNVQTIATDGSLESTISSVRSQFSAKVVLVNHEKSLNVDTQCANIAIKYNMLYISVYQLIKKHICEGTAFGKALLAKKAPKKLSADMTKDGDKFNEA